MILVSSCKILWDMAPIVGAKVSWTIARLVIEVMDHGLHVIKNPPMIKLFGHTKFVGLVVFGTVGWQEGVRTLSFSYTFKLAYYPTSLVSKVVLDVFHSST